VAEMTLALMLGALRRIAYLDREMRAGRAWQLPVETYDQMGEIAGRTVGLIGYGEIPRRIAPALSALGGTLLYTSRTPKLDALGKPVALPELLAASDIVSLHVPLTPETQRLIDARAIAQMKRGSILINTARGGLVDEEALVAALRSGHLRAAGLDVLTIEPPVAQNPLCDLDNVVVTPHIAWLTPETLDRSLGIAIENCRRLAQGEPLQHEVVRGVR
jgi:phosphoglycerate dehydrogenase-like enzyme